MEQTRGVFAEQVIRPTGLIDPPLEIRPVEEQVQDCIHEFVGKNLFTTNVDDYCGYQMITTGLWPWLSGFTMFSSRYPHSATTWPDSRKVANKMVEGMETDDVSKVLQDNAVKVYGFDLG